MKINCCGPGVLCITLLEGVHSPCLTVHHHHHSHLSCSLTVSPWKEIQMPCSCLGFFNLFEIIYLFSYVENDLSRFHNQNAMSVFHLRLLWQRVFWDEEQHSFFAFSGKSQRSNNKMVQGQCFGAGFLIFFI